MSQRNYWRWFVLYALVYGCAACVKFKPLPNFVDPELRPYVQQFIAEAAYRGHDYRNFKIQMYFASLDVGILGECYPYEHTTPVVRIDSSEWAKLPEYMREQLVFHELGHCWIGRNHDDHEFNGRPTSIMNSVLFLQFYNFNREEYIDELFDYHQEM